MHRSAVSGEEEKNPGTSYTLTSCCTNGNKTSHFVRFEKLERMFRIRSCTPHAPRHRARLYLPACLTVTRLLAVFLRAGKSGLLIVLPCVDRGAGSAFVFITKGCCVSTEVLGQLFIVFVTTFCCLFTDVLGQLFIVFVTTFCFVFTEVLGQLFSVFGTSFAVCLQRC